MKTTTALAVLAVLFAPLAAPETCFAAPRAEAKASRALKLFEQSEVRYRAGEFARAAALLREAYALYPQPILLYNLGQALEAEGELSLAIDAYTRYLGEEKELNDRGAILARIEKLRTQLAERERLVRERTTAEAGQLAAERARTDAERARLDAEARAQKAQRSVARRIAPAPWILASLGLVGLAAGTGVAVVALKRHDQAVGESVQARAVGLQDDARSFALGANVALGIGGVLFGVGIVWGVIDARRAARPVRAWLGPEPAGVAVAR